MHLLPRAVLSVWLISIVLVALLGFGASSFFGLPFWVRWIMDGGCTAAVLCSMWGRR
jgi:hypothetical protein